MGYIQYYSYNCQRCGNPTQHQLFVLQCQSCGVPMCKNCSKGALCFRCFNSLPQQLQEKYHKQLNSPKIILGIILGAIAIPMGIFAPPLLIFLVIIGCKAYSMDHGKYKTTRKSVLRKAQNIVSEVRQQGPPPTTQPSQQQQNAYPQQQNTYQQQQNTQQKQQDPDQKYDGTFWEP